MSYGFDFLFPGSVLDAMATRLLNTDPSLFRNVWLPGAQERDATAEIKTNKRAECDLNLTRISSSIHAPSLFDSAVGVLG